MPLRLTAIVAGVLLMMIPFVAGCGGEQAGSDSTATVPPGSGEVGSMPPVLATTFLAWSPVADPSVSAYIVHYGRHSPGQPGSCAYESSLRAASPSATVTDLDPNTVYYFAVSAYNGMESACSPEVSTVTSPASV